MDNGQSLSPIIEKLESLFSSFNNYFYQGELQKPIITISSNNRKVNCLGWCTSWKAWDNSDKQSGYETSGYYEINICAEYLDRPFKEICNTMLHEMAHLYNAQSDIQDTCRSGTYHNKHFRETAESHGLTVSKHPERGFAITDLNNETISFISTIREDEFEIHRKRNTTKYIEKPKSSTRKYICKKCGLIIRATREVHVLCIACGIEFTQSQI